MKLPTTADADGQIKINKKGVSAILRSIRQSHELNITIKLQIFNSNVKSILLYRYETWKTTKQLTQSHQIFVNKSLRNILRIRWSKVISNEELDHSKKFFSFIERTLKSFFHEDLSSCFYSKVLVSQPFSRFTATQNVNTCFHFFLACSAYRIICSSCYVLKGNLNCCVSLRELHRALFVSYSILVGSVLLISY